MEVAAAQKFHENVEVLPVLVYVFELYDEGVLQVGYYFQFV